MELHVIPAHLEKLKIGIDFKTMVWKLLDYEQGADAF